jgi:hypothetical protein
MRSDPAKVGGEIFRWLGLDAGENTLETVRNLSRERFSELGVPDAAPPSGPPVIRGARRVAGLARAAIDRAERRVHQQGDPDASEDAELAFNFVQALRAGDAEGLRSMMADSMGLTYRSPDGDLVSQGREAHDGLIAIARQTFADSPASDWWASAPSGPREWWCRGRGEPFRMIFYSRIGGDATRADLAFGLTPKDGLIMSILVVSAGPPAGRPVRQLDPAALLADG